MTALWTAKDQPPTKEGSDALAQFIRALERRGYLFVTPGGATIALNRRGRADEARTLRDIFGWSLDFAEKDLEPGLFALATRAGILRSNGDRWRSLVRISTVEGRLFAHSAYPPKAADAVFLGPDTYRFARLAAAEAAKGGQSVLDVGTGAGVGAIIASSRLPRARVTACDINAAALYLAQANAEANGRPVEFVLSDGLSGVAGGFDLIIANPPFISGRFGRVYRDGGADRGLEVPMAWAREGAQRLNRAGRMLIYTGSPIVDAEDAFRRRLEQMLPGLGLRLDYEEIDPDIFGGMLERSDYRGVERLAAVAAVIRRP
ncbi:class I SAM-dependent methyltransferase [Caulobacter segnis]|uniref:class I SAM-dependent methyltransferase n=1 Tax=Caulobacter segnis TaxID=88688 RepID=UPI0024108BF6|nr:class I SAM-dependent methyltransferase [Caulobacter segnis]MDG2520364.1 class I SAM-dependent methyltransferase [Caulobacter segnis]